MADYEKILSNRFDVDEAYTLPVAERQGAYRIARRAVTAMQPDQLKAEVKAANIRGRGGAGFPAGVKWGFLPPDRETTYLVINADEGEPGTFKDRQIMEKDPHRLIEGCIITMYAIGANVTYIYVRCELVKSIQRLEAAVEEARAKGYLGKRPFGKDHPLEIHIHPGAGAYICGEETALLNSLEGKRGEPRLKPPFPAVVGAFGEPTIVNNVETIAAVPDIVEMGGEKWSNISLLPESFRDGGTRLYGVSGHVKTPGIYEAPVGITLRELVYDLGGGMLHDDRPLKGVIPGGSSTPVVHPDHTVNAPNEDDPMHPWHGKSHLDVPMGVDTMRNIGTMLGTCCAIVMDSSVNMAEAARNLMKFYKHESCGQCTPCREGSGWLVDVLDQIATGSASRAEVDMLVDISNNMMGNTICALADGTAMPMLGFIRKYPDDFYQALETGMGENTRLDAAVRALVDRRAA
ncbi:MAG TPA: NADH-quinone oxidoreductase subunit NuoF [Sandaracinaceae bacterium LLY-WYZ-13_1]|nr:NADH-quinone oxidoreductase subunit NuoF [Sandaracinaceae bacterium LLY-WYZ-13_1]